MKTVKLVLVATFVSSAMMSFSHPVLFSEKPADKLSLENAMMAKGLVQAIQLQITTDLIAIEHPVFYYAKVRYNNKIIFIYGTYQEWKRFFHDKFWVSKKEVSEAPVKY